MAITLPDHLKRRLKFQKFKITIFISQWAICILKQQKET